MIPWFYDMKEFKKFPGLSEKKRQAVIDKHREFVYGQEQILNERAEQLKKNARDVQRRLKRGNTHKATEGMMTVAFDLKNAEPEFSNYINSLLLLRMYEIMHIEGYVDPATLPQAMEGIDYGLYSLTTEDQLRDTLDSAINPFKMFQ